MPRHANILSYSLFFFCFKDASWAQGKGYGFDSGIFFHNTDFACSDLFWLTEADSQFSPANRLCTGSKIFGI